VFGGPAWTWDARRRQYYMHNFLKEQPQLNVANPEVQDALIDAMRFWLDRGVDGFRLDAINFAIHDPKLTDNPAFTSNGKRTRPFDFQDKVHNQSQPEIRYSSAACGPWPTVIRATASSSPRSAATGPMRR
jgi:alpha-glucosidase